jgi:hypothetical protein
MNIWTFLACGSLTNRHEFKVCQMYVVERPFDLSLDKRIMHVMRESPLFLHVAQQIISLIIDHDLSLIR